MDRTASVSSRSTPTATMPTSRNLAGLAPSPCSSSGSEGHPTSEPIRTSSTDDRSSCGLASARRSVQPVPFPQAARSPVARRPSTPFAVAVTHEGARRASCRHAAPDFSTGELQSPDLNSILWVADRLARGTRSVSRPRSRACRRRWSTTSAGRGSSSRPTRAGEEEAVRGCTPSWTSSCCAPSRNS